MRNLCFASLCLLSVLQSSVLSSFYWEHHELPKVVGLRQYRDYAFDPKTGFIRPIAAVVKPREPKKGQRLDKPIGAPHDFTKLEAIPYSLEQFIRAYGHSLLDSAWDISEIAPVVHLHYIWIAETNRPISLPCWAPAQVLEIEFNQTTFRGHKRTWLIGQGNTLSLSMASAFGYKVDPASGALLLSPFTGLQSGHSVFTCLLSREAPAGEKARPRVSFTQTHMLYYQTNEESLQTARGKVELELDLVMYTPESDGPPCQLYPYEPNTVVCRDAAWQQIRNIDVWSPNAGYRYNHNERLGIDTQELLKNDLINTTKDFCRIYSCTSELSITEIKPTYPNETVLPVLHFFGDRLKLPNKSIITINPIWDKPTTESTPATEKQPGDSILNARLKIKFTNGMIDCPMAQSLFQPDLGDLQQTAHYMAFDDVPFNPLTRMLTPHELTWVRERKTPDAVKYRPTFCVDQNLKQDNFDGVEVPVYNVSSGYTILFAVPISENGAAVHVQFSDMLGRGSCDAKVNCTNEICDMHLIYNEDDMIMSVPPYPTKGLYKPIEAQSFPGIQYITVIVGAPVLSDQIQYQHVIVLRNLVRVSEGALRRLAMVLSENCGGTATTNINENGFVKILNWPAYELIGPSFERSKEAFNHLIKPCNESFTGIPYSASGEPPPLTLYPNNERDIHFSTTGTLCSDACDLHPKNEENKNITFECETGRGLEPCMRQYYVTIKREIYEQSLHANNWRYTAFAVQYCDAEFERIKDDAAYSIATGEAMACHISGHIRSLSHVLMCQLQQSLDELKGDLKRCKFQSYDDAMVHRHPVSVAKMKLQPVVKKCLPKTEPPKLFAAYERGVDHVVHRLSYNERGCPIGNRLSKTFSVYRCLACPPDSYADLDTELTSCQGCPLSRPSTFSGWGASSAQCSNEQLNKLRGLFFRYDMSDMTDDQWDQSFNLSSQMWWNRDYKLLENLDHLKPVEKYLEQQRQAVALFKAMNQLTFSNTEIFLMLVISSTIAIYGLVNFMILLTATSRPSTCPAKDFYGPQPNWRERAGLAIYCFLFQIAAMIASIVYRAQRRLMREYGRLRKSANSTRISQATSNISKKLSNIVKQHYEKSRLPPLTQGQKTLIHLLTRTTIDRIVESAERELSIKRDHERAIQEEQRRRRHEAAEVEAEAHEAELAAEAAKREAEKAEEMIADAKDGKSKTAATQKAEKAKANAANLAARAASLRTMAQRRISALNEFSPDEQLTESEKQANRWLNERDQQAVENAASELRAYLRVPRYHTSAFFLLHAEMHEQAEMRKTAYPAPEREFRHDM